MTKSVTTCYDESANPYECMFVVFIIDDEISGSVEIPLAEATEERINQEICAWMAKLPE